MIRMIQPDEWFARRESVEELLIDTGATPGDSQEKNRG